MSWHRTDTALVDAAGSEALGNLMARVPFVSDEQLAAMGSRWEGREAGDARQRALGFETPDVVAALLALDDVQLVFATDLAGDNTLCQEPAARVRQGVNAIRDAIAAVVARPVLSRAQFSVLIKPWQQVMGNRPAAGAVNEDAVVLASAGRMAAGWCHEPEFSELRDRLLAASYGLGEASRVEAREETKRAAIATGRIRVWHAARVPTAGLFDRLSLSCPDCRMVDPEVLRESKRVLAVTQDAASALVVADALGEPVDVLVDPVRFLIPAQRRTGF